MIDVLIVDRNGTPRDWVNLHDAACYYAREKVIWDTGTLIKTFTGGKNEIGETSRIDIKSILGVTGPIFGDDFYNRETIYADRIILYNRDMYLCAYCGEEFNKNYLTIDHVYPQSRGGKNIWVNTVTSCKPCNVRKGARTPEEAKMPLLYVPYAPSLFDKMILKGKNILADQMEFLAGRASKNFKERQKQFN
jgi:hypothetical protein